MNEKNLGGYAISIEMYYWILENLSKGSTILELGSGTGTVELAEYYNVFSIEHNKRWLNHAKAKYIYAPIVSYRTKDVYKWYDREIIKAKIPEKYDLLLVDGPNGSIGREGFVNNITLFNMNVPIIIDDTQRKKEADICDFIRVNYNKKVILIQGVDKQFTILL